MLPSSQLKSSLSLLRYLDLDEKSVALKIYVAPYSQYQPSPFHCQESILIMWKQTLQKFIESPSNFSILFESGAKRSTRIPRPLAVLDSSFNPPHAAHYSLITESKPSTSILDSHIILLLSISNADKGRPDLVSLSQRVQMMTLFANRIVQDHPSALVLVATTKHAMFVHKALEIHSEFQCRATFLMGFDTLVRMLDAKYYVPQSLADAVGPFFDIADLVVLARDQKGNTAQSQQDWVRNIAEGKRPDVPLLWAKHIYLKKPEGTFSSVSSSQIRLEIMLDNASWRQYVIPQIQDFIDAEQLYRSE